MTLRHFRIRQNQFQEYAFILVVVAAYISTFVLTSRPYHSLEVIFMLGLGAGFVAMDLWGDRRLYRWNPSLAPYVYFGVQVPIAGIMLYLSQGNAWLLLMPLAAQAVFRFSLTGVIGLNFLFLVMLVANMSSVSRDLRQIGQGLVAFQTAFLFVFVFTKSMLREQTARLEVQALADQLAEANRQLREYAARVEELAGSQERNRLAREIHDGLGHYLTALNIQIRAASAVMEIDPPRAQAALDKAEGLARDALVDVRRSVAALRGEPSLTRPLPDALASLIEESRTAGLVCDLNLLGIPRALPSPVELTLFRAAQEGLTNVHKHSLASQVQLELEYYPGGVRLQIHDNGLGAALSAPPSGDVPPRFGLVGLKERVQLLGGELTVSSAPSQGFCLEIVLKANGDRTDPNSAR
jgi:signal transduction histidine kinase